MQCTYGRSSCVTANVEKKRKEVSVSNPRVQINVPIDATLFKLCHSLIILPHGFSWCIHHHHHHHHSLFLYFPFTHLQVQPKDVEIVITCCSMYLLNHRCQMTEDSYNTMIVYNINYIMKSLQSEIYIIINIKIFVNRIK